MLFLAVLVFCSGIALTVYAVLSWLAGPDPDLAAGGYDPRTTCGRPGCISHPRERR